MIIITRAPSPRKTYVGTCQTCDCGVSCLEQDLKHDRSKCQQPFVICPNVHCNRVIPMDVVFKYLPGDPL